jgi:hypothetical protein
VLRDDRISDSKNQKQFVDYVKQVIKSGRKHKSAEKLRSLKLLNKAIMASETNQNFVVYVQKKIMKRLTQLS